MKTFPNVFKIRLHPLINPQNTFVFVKFLIFAFLFHDKLSIKLQKGLDLSLLLSHFTYEG